jgi:histidinol phosphatase-like enzyme
VWRGRPANAAAIVVEPAVIEALRHWADAGYVLAGTSWLTTGALDEKLAELLERPIVVARCGHPAGPPICWCRKPLPGLALWLARQHGLDLARSVHIGRGPADRGFAARAGLRYVDAADGFPLPDGVATPANSAS